MTDTIEYRSWTPDLEVRSEGNGRTVVGIAVPWNVVQRIDDDLTEEFLPDAFRAQMQAANRVILAREHLKLGGSLIGRLNLMRNDAKGLYIEAPISRTHAGEETLELLKDRVLEEMSIGFREKQNRRRPDGVIQRVTAHLAEVAIVLEGAYGRAARATGVRSAVDDGTCPTCGQHATPQPRSGLVAARSLLAELPPVLPVR